MTARIDRRFEALRAEGRAGFVAYVLAGDPDRDASLEILRGLPAAGADLIELGFPFSDPMAEGPTIQRAAQRSLKAGTTLADTLGIVRAFREGAEGVREARLDTVPDQHVRNEPQKLKMVRRPPGVKIDGTGDSDTPLILMGYLNPLLTYGLDRFAVDAAAAGVDGLIVVDCPPEEADPLADTLDAHGIALIRLAAPTTDDRRLPAVLRRTSGFLYYVSVAGVTGVKAADAVAVAPAVERLRAASGLPVAVGFGIKTPEQAAAVARVADAVVVGSALVEAVAQAVAAGEPPAPRVLAKAAELARAVRRARVTEPA